MTLVAKSRITGGRPGSGTPAQNGLVPKRASAPPCGATMAREMTLTKCIDTRPASAACSAQAPMRPRWCALPSATMQLPCLRALDAQRHGFLPMTWPKPALPSSRSSAPASSSVLTCGVGHQAAFEVGIGITRQHADAVRVVAGEVGFDQVAGHGLHFGLAAAEAAHHQAHGVLQAGQGNQVGVAHAAGVPGVGEHSC
jgi:hypothetical protein